MQESTDQADRAGDERRVEVTVVIPAYDATEFLPKVIPAALAAARGRRVLVVDPGSTDGTPEMARELGAEVLSLGHRGGPALARNRGVELVTTDVALFVDADCVAHPDIVERVERAFAEDPELVSLTGSYDDVPPARNFASLYMNLRHHFVHQSAKREGASFWTGLGAVRVSAFRAVGGFDEEQFPAPMVEDIELGLRLRAHGRMRLDPTLHVTHLNRWSLGKVVHTDVFKRAVPWGRIILRTGEMPNDLNLGTKQRVAALLAPFALLGLVGAPIAFALGAPLVGAALGVPLLASVALHLPLIGFFRRAAGLPFALGGYLFHQVHLTYSAVTMAVLYAERALRPARPASAAPPDRSR